MLFTILYVFFVSTTFESAENNRYRFNTEGFYVVLLGLFVYRVILGWYRRGPSIPIAADAAGSPAFQRSS
jgi:membrane protein CcdC involved in cytochrome C biogenesis